MNPLVSFCIKSFNQKQYIGAAINAALAQTYRPLEIVISDNASTDGSWELIQEKVAAYRKSGGDISIVLNRNAENLGNLGNWDCMGDLAHGELLVKADGDDISLPERTAEVVKAWEEDGKRAVLVNNGLLRMDVDGVDIGIERLPSAKTPLGAAMSWSIRCFRAFPKCEDGTMLDDIVYAWRARLLGGEVTVPASLVRYRIGSGICSVGSSPRQPSLKGYQAIARASRQVAKDIEHLYAVGRLSADAYDEYKRELEGERQRAEWQVQLLSGNSFFVRLSAFRKLMGGSSVAAFLLRFVYLLPPALGDFLLGNYAGIKARRQKRRLCHVAA